MAEETQAKAEEVAVEKAAVTDPLPPASAEESEKPAVEPESEEKKPEKPAVETETEEQKPAAEEAEAEGEGEVDVSSAIQQSESFKEESNVVGDLQDPEKKALDELKQLVSAALANNEFVPPPPPPPPPAKEEPKPEEAKTAAEEAKTEEPVSAPAAEEAKTEEPVAAPTAEEAKTAAAEETKPEEPVSAPAVEEPPKPAAEEAKPEEPVVTPAAEEVKTIPEPEPEGPVAPPAVEEVVAVEEKAVDDDGAKTVEAIEETIISVAAPEVAPGEPPAEPAAETAVEETPAPQPPAEEFLWGVPLLSDEKSDTILLKFLRARDFKVKDALSMIKSTVIWRKTFGIDALLNEDLGLPEMNKVVFMHGVDKEGHPVCYNVYGEFQDKDLYAKAFGDEEKRQKFLRWRIQFLEKGIRQQLDFSPGGVCTMVQVNDLKNSPGPGKRELRQTTNQALALLQDNYPEFVAKQIFINVPWWYLAYNRVISPFLTQRTKSKFVFAGPSKSAETLFKYIAPEQVPVRYGGLNIDNDPDFTVADAVTDITIKPSSKETIEIPVSEASVLVWELRVLGWDVTYGAEFAPSAENGYTVIVQKARKLIATDEPVVKNSFKIGEPGKIILTIDNTTSKKKKLLYRSKAKTSAEPI